MFERFKDMIGIEDEYEYYDDYDEYEETDLDETKKIESQVDQDSFDESEKVFTRRSSSLSMQASPKTSSDNIKINIHEPLSYEDSPKVLDSIIDHRAVVLNLEMLEVDVKKQVFNFVSGGIYALEGKIEKVTKDIFIIAPSDVIIDGSLKDRIQDKGFYQY